MSGPFLVRAVTSADVFFDVQRADHSCGEVAPSVEWQFVDGDEHTADRETEHAVR
jgi:hypothetical protein